MVTLIFFLLFLLPFTIFPFGISPFETPKVYLAELTILILVVWYVISFPIKQLINLRFFPLLLLGLLGVVHLVLQPSETVLFGNIFRMQGVFLLWLLLLFTVVSSQLSIKNPAQKIILLLLGLQLLATIFIEGKIDGRGIGTMGEPNALAAYAVFLWPWLFFATQKEKKKAFLIAGTITAVVLVLFSGSRSGFIAFGLQALFLLLLHFKISFSKAAAISLVLFIASLSFPFIQKQMLYENRADVWRVVFAAGWEKPFLGWGIGNTEKALHDTSIKINNVVRYQKVDSSHNIFLDWWVQGGIIGVSLFLFIVISAALRLVKRKEALYFVLLLGLLTVMSFNPVSVVTLVQFWWFIGQGFKQ